MSGVVSVIIPTYERSEYLRGAIETALGQTYEKVEVIVVDDGSTETYADRIVSNFPANVSCIRHQENRGLSAARNTGIYQANGEYIAFLDDDDRWHETKLARQVEALRSNNSVGLVTCLVASISPENKVLHCESTAPSGDCSNELLIGNTIGTPSRVVVRREVAEDLGGFDEALPTKQDWDFYIRLSQGWKISAIEDHLCFRTIHKSMSSSPVSSRRDNQKILERHRELMCEHGKWIQANAEVAERVGRAYLKQGDLKAAREHLRKSTSLDPTINRILILATAYTCSPVISTLVWTKRQVVPKLNGCSNLEIDTIPGLQS
jgi:glycosyltransferase involved in cell wall biosynthesis